MKGNASRVIVTLLALFVGVAEAQPISLVGKTVTVLVGNPPGGGYDRFARLVARHLGRYLPGNPAVVVQNMPGAAGIVAANHLYNVARPDGLTIGLFNRNLVLGQLVGVEGFRVDMRKWQWLGSLAEDAYVLFIRSDLPYRHVLELRRAEPPVVLGATGPGAGSYDYPIVLRAFLKLNVRIVSGYSGTGDRILAMERKEVDGTVLSWSSAAAHVQRGLLRPLVRTQSGLLELQHIPVDTSLVTETIAKGVLELLSIPNQVARPFVAPPGAPPELVRLYRQAFRSLAEDSSFREEARRLQFDIAYVPGEEAARLIDKVLSSPPAIVRVLKSFYRFGE